PSLFIISALFGAAACASFAIAAGLPWPQRRAKPAQSADDDEYEEDEEKKEEETADRASAWLGFVVHALLSWKTRLLRLVRPKPRARMHSPADRVEPGFGSLRRGTPAVMSAPDEEEDDEEDEAEDDARPAPRRRAAAARIPPRRAGNGYVLPSLNLLAPARVSDRTTMSKEQIEANASALETVLQDFG